MNVRAKRRPGVPLPAPKVMVILTGDRRQLARAVGEACAGIWGDLRGSVPEPKKDIDKELNHGSTIR